MDFFTAILIALNTFHCHGVSLKEQLEHIETRRLENLGYFNGFPGFRKMYEFNPGENSVILGSPSMPNHLPEAEPILPGHTLIRPALGMLKSSVKFPHKDWENGAGVYGNINSLGITYGGTNERVLYSGFRRSGDKSDLSSSDPNSPIVLLLTNSKNDKVGGRYKHASKEKRKRQQQYNNPLHLTKPSNDILMSDAQDDASNERERYSKKSKKKRRRRSKKKYNRNKKYKLQKPKDGSGVQYDRDMIINQIDRLKTLNLPDLGYDGYSKQLRDIRRFEIPSTAEDHKDTSSDIDIEETNLPLNSDPNPKLTWLISSQDLYNHIKISQDAPEWSEIMPASPKDYDEKEWVLFSKG